MLGEFFLREPTDAVGGFRIVIVLKMLGEFFLREQILYVKS